MTFPVRTEPGYRHDWLKKSPDRDFGVENGVYKAGQGTVAEGTVLATDADGKLVPYGGAVESDTVALSYYEARTGAGAEAREVEGPIITRRCWLNYAALKFAVDATPAQKAAAFAKLSRQEMPDRREI
jgi:Bacteriophage lambda head decoration protein D